MVTNGLTYSKSEGSGDTKSLLGALFSATEASIQKQNLGWGNISNSITITSNKSVTLTNHCLSHLFLSSLNLYQHLLFYLPDMYVFLVSSMLELIEDPS